MEVRRNNHISMYPSCRTIAIKGILVKRHGRQRGAATRRSTLGTSALCIYTLDIQEDGTSPELPKSLRSLQHQQLRACVTHIGLKLGQKR